MLTRFKPVTKYTRVDQSVGSIGCIPESYILIIAEEVNFS